MRKLFDCHPDYRENALTKRRFKHDEVVELIKKSGFAYEKVGESFEGRDILKVVVGYGKRKVLLWSQMHGDEATATMAIFDIFNFFKAKFDGFQEFRDLILSELELHFVPMLNPDGAQRFQRSTAQEIDMNRDAVALQCPESRILKGLVTDLQPEFSFNLHDQSVHYAAGENPKQASISFLATAYNKATDWNETRTKSMQVICQMNAGLQEIIPEGVGRFSDEFEPRAFGDNIQKWGSSLILVESGGYPNDREKQYIRALNFQAILSALSAIANDSYRHFELKHYEAIPKNEWIFVDLKIENLKVRNSENKTYLVDIGIVCNEVNNADATDFTLNGIIEELGDLSVLYGLQTFNADGGVLRPIEDFPNLIEKYKINAVPNKFQIGENATFVIDFGKTQTLVLNGEIV